MPASAPRRIPPEAHLRWDQVAAFRLDRHRLSTPASPRELADVVGGMAGVQAQLPSAAEISLWARIPDLRRDQLTAALGPDRSLARAWCMRRTVHLVPARDLAIYVRGTAHRADREITWMRGKGAKPDELEALIACVLRALDRPRTRTEVAERVAEDLGLRSAVHRGGGWGNERDHAAVEVAGLPVPGDYLLHLAGARGVVCAGPSRENEATFVRGDAWVREWRDVPPERAEVELLRRYLRAFAPARVDDFAWWTGMRLSNAAAAWGRLSEEIAAVDVEGASAEALRADLAELRDARLDPRRVHLLPYFDGFLLGHRDDRHAVRTQHRAAVYRPQGWVAPVVLHRGRALGTWRHERHGARVRIEISPFGAIRAEVARRAASTGEELGRFLGGGTTEISVRGPRAGRGRATGGRPRKGTG